MGNKVVLGLYVGEYTSNSFAINVAGLALELNRQNMLWTPSKSDGFGVLQYSSCRVDSNRNWLIDYFLKETDGDFLFIIDEDMIHHPLSGVVLAKRNLPIVCGLYFKRDNRGIHHPMFYKNVGESLETRRGYAQGTVYPTSFQPLNREVAEFLEKVECPAHDGPQILTKESGEYPMEGGLLEIDASGFGCVMLRRDALEKMTPPYLMDEPGLNGDLVFYRNAKQLNIPIFGDMSVIASHRLVTHIGVGSFVNWAHKLDMERQYAAHPH